MAKMNRNILGNLRGRLGNVVFIQRNGKTFVRTHTTPDKSKETDKQRKQRAKFKLVSDFVTTIKDLVKISFCKHAKGMSERNYATSFIYRNALKTDGEDIVLDYSKIRVSGGNLEKPIDVVAYSIVPGVIDFTWRDNSKYYVSPADRAILVAHCPVLNKTIYSISDEKRADCFGALRVPEFSMKEVHTWMAFIADNGQVSNSEYAGLITVSAKPR